MTLAEFLEARLAEDEAVASAATHQKVAGPSHGSWVADSAALMANGALDRADRAHIARHDPARALREVAAKRAILAEWVHMGDVAELEWESGQSAEAWAFGDKEAGLKIAVVALASVYADHPDYRGEWA